MSRRGQAHFDKGRRWVDTTVLGVVYVCMYDERAQAVVALLLSGALSARRDSARESDIDPSPVHFGRVEHCDVCIFFERKQN